MKFTVYDNSIVLTGQIGEGTVISSFVFIGDGVRIGKDCKIKPHCFIGENTTIGDNVFMAPGVIVLNDRKPPSGGKHWAPVIIGNNVSIGGGCTIAPGVVIGNGAKVRAGSVVTRSVKDGEYYDDDRSVY